MNPVHTQVTANDLGAFRRWSLATARGRRVWDAICTARALGAALIAASFTIAFSWLVFVGAIVSVVAMYAALIQARQVRNARNSALLPTLSGTYMLDDVGIRIDVDNGATHFYPWGALERVATTAEFIFLMPSAATAWIVPKRCFASTGEVDEFVTYALLAKAPPA